MIHWNGVNMAYCAPLVSRAWYMAFAWSSDRLQLDQEVPFCVHDPRALLLNIDVLPMPTRMNAENRIKINTAPIRSEAMLLYL